MEWIKTTEKKNYRIIVLGDFNDNLHNKLSKTNTPILQFMRNHNIISHIDYHAITEPTWQRGDRNSQIDDIWTTASLVPQCNSLSIMSSAFLTASDHKILMITCIITSTYKLQEQRKIGERCTSTTKWTNPNGKNSQKRSKTGSTN